MTTVVTGASGHIGAALVRHLLARGERVRVLIHRDARALDGLAVEAVPGDVLDPESLCAAFAGADTVYHLAGVISITGDSRGRVRAVNVGGAENAARAALQCGARRLVHCSSVHAFDLRDAPVPLDETAPRAPDDPRRYAAYDRSKAEGERRVRALIAQGLDAVITHPTAVIGPFDFAPSHMGRVLLALYRRRLPALVQGGFDFVDVRDVAAGLAAAAERGGCGESYLLSGHYCSMVDLAALAAAVTGRRPPRLTLPVGVARLGTGVMSLAARRSGAEPLYTAESLGTLRRGRPVDHAKALRDLGYRPRPTAESVGDAYRWFAERGVIPGGAVPGEPGPADGHGSQAG
jgi:dihydroflavonol-4-reductase